MMTQEEFMDVMAMKRQGMSIKEIAEETGYHPSTISGWLRNGGPPERRPRTSVPVIDEYWAGEIAALLRTAPRLLATSVFELIRAEGYTGSYVSVARHLNTLRGPRFAAAPAASTRIVTAPGEEAQFDWSDVSHWTREWGLGEVQCFSAILSFSRVRIWWFARSVDREHTFEGLVRFFEFVGGVPKVLRTDRMGALGTSQGRRFRLHPPAHGFAQFCGTEIRACQARDAKRKGKVERPFRDVKERFLEECTATGAPTSLAELNERAARWLEHARPCPAAPRHRSRPRRTTGRRSAACSERCPAGDSTRPMSKPAGSMWPSPRSSGAACATRCHHAVWASASKCAKRWRGPASRSAGPESTWPPTPSPTPRGWRSGMRCTSKKPRRPPCRAAGAATSASSCPTTLQPATLPLRLDIAGDVDVDVPDLARYETDGARS